ncbi:hypothetical protein BDR05DRAFT_620222 [Suillus weaverae]|nr:hypothetical protein BDR05DRAFT_620222 [Suillus weaverae]
MDRTSSCERSRSLVQQASLGTITREESQLPARPDSHYAAKQHSNTEHPTQQLLLIRHILLSLRLLRQRKHHQVLVLPSLDGALVLWAGCAACLFSTLTVNIRDAVATSVLATETLSSQHNITAIQAGYWTNTPWVLWISVRLLVGHFLSSHTVLMAVCTPLLHCISLSMYPPTRKRRRPPNRGRARRRAPHHVCTSHSQASDTLTCAFAGAELVSFDLSPRDTVVDWSLSTTMDT